LFLVLKGKPISPVFKRCTAAVRGHSWLLQDKEVIWLHAVSLGEVSTCKSLIKQLSVRYPQKIIVVTTITPTGKALAESIAQGNVVSLYMPFDVSFLIQAFIKTIHPSVLILMETELWPNTLYYAQKNKIPVFVFNARLSDRSFAKYRRYRWFTERLTAGVRCFCVQTQLDGERLRAVGIPPQKINFTGNMKFDAIEELDSKQLDEVSRLKENIALGIYDFLIVAGSTHPREEEYVLRAFIELKKEFHSLRLLIAPRHLERLTDIEGLIASKQLRSQRLSVLRQADKDAVLLVDTIGKLRLLYSLGNLVFVGGSLVAVGGHNILEPAFFAKPIIVGPYMHNFREIMRLFVTHNAVAQIKNESQLFSSMKELIADKDKSAQLGRAAKSVVASHQGATFKNLSIITETIA